MCNMKIKVTISPSIQELAERYNIDLVFAELRQTLFGTFMIDEQDIEIVFDEYDNIFISGQPEGCGSQFHLVRSVAEIVESHFTDLGLG